MNMAHLRDVALLELLASSGCRISEVINLNVKDIDLAERPAVVLGKGNKERRVWFSVDAAKFLQEYWTSRKAQPDEPAFSRHDRSAAFRIERLTTDGARMIVKGVALLAGVKKFSPHYFRHGFAIRALAETKNLALVQDLLGHSSPTATRVYAKIYPEELQIAHRGIFDATKC
jgi:integrase/recombinase XerD